MGYGLWVMDTRTLVAAYRGGDATAGNALFEMLRPWLRMLAGSEALGRFGAKFDRDDLVQQTLLEATRGFPQFRGDTEPELLGWVRQILARVVAHEIRRFQGTQKRDIDLEVSLDQSLSASAGRLGDMLAGSGTSPGTRMDRREREVALARVLERLPEDYRTVLVLRHLEGLSHEEIARRMGRGAGSVRMLWARALGRLREELIQDGGLGTETG